MTTPLDRPRLFVPLSILLGLLCAAVFIIDLLTEQTGMEVWIFYLAPLALSLFLWRPGAPIAIAAACSGLLVAGFLAEPAGTHIWSDELNRVFLIVTLWVVGVIARQMLISRRKLTRQNWLRTGQNELSARMQGQQSLEELGGSILGFLAPFMGAHVGALYTANGDDQLHRSAAYAFTPDPATETFQIGEGLIGQAAAQRKKLRVREAPPAYLTVRSALGSAPPTEVLIAPALLDGRVEAVLELGFLKAVEVAAAEELMEMVGQSIGAAVRSALYRKRLEELLDETQRQAELLQRQQEELRVTNEELEDQSSRLRESQSKLERQQAELEQTNTQLEEQTHLLQKQKEELLGTQEELTLKARELTRAVRYKSEFMANMSHELRTPLNSALILARLLTENKEGNLSERQVKFAETIYSSGNDLLALIDDILDLSKIEAGRLEVRPETVVLERAVESLVQTFQPVAAEKGLDWTFAIEPGTPRALETDRRRFQQILKNLLSNAFKFTEQGGVTLRVASEGDRVVFSVTDSGIGIPEDQLATIFEAFRQADGTSNRRYGGTGLGLSISRDLTHLLGGVIEVDSAPGRGSTFRVILPPRPPAEAIAEREAAPTPALVPAPESVAAGAAPQARQPAWDDRDDLTGAARKILVIEDDEAFARILFDLAHEKDFQCLVATSADEGLRLAGEHAPSAVILDIGLPDSSGLAVLEQLKRGPKTRHIPVHIVSVADCAEAALAMGAVGHILKPVTREALVGAFDRLEAKLSQKIKRLLVVEDDEVHREAIVRLLDARDVEIVAVATAAEALARVREGAFDCMVTDLHLPDARGGALLEQMSRDESCPFPPVIVYTGRDLSPEEEQQLGRFSRSIIIKGARSPERLLDEATLFLHQVETALPPERQRMLQRVRDRDDAFDGRRILVAEDDVRNLFALSSILEPRGAEVAVARNGREALEMLSDGPSIDLVLMDIMMPEMDGLEAMRRIRKQSRWAKLPIIALTAKAMPDDLHLCRSAGANDYMPKPVDVDKLVSLMRVWLSR